MKPIEYKFIFKGGDCETVFATGYGDALILALAKRINAGMNGEITEAYSVHGSNQTRLHFEFIYKL